MKRSIVLSALALSSVLLSGCILHTGPGPSRSRGSARAQPSCGPAYHWDGNQCVHNGKAKGHYKHKHRD